MIISVPQRRHRRTTLRGPPLTPQRTKIRPYRPHIIPYISSALAIVALRRGSQGPKPIKVFRASSMPPLTKPRTKVLISCAFAIIFWYWSLAWAMLSPDVFASSATLLACSVAMVLWIASSFWNKVRRIVGAVSLGFFHELL